VPDLDQSKVSTCSFEAAQLHVGERLQLELVADGSRSHYYTTLIGFVPGHSVLIRTPMVQNLPVPVPEGADVLVRAFSGRHAFTMESRVDRVCRSPYPYMHLAYPAQVQQTIIRGALRVRVALLETELSLGEPGEKFRLAFKFVVQPNNYEVKLATSAQIQSVRKIKKGNGQEELFSHGVRFNKLHATEGLLLQSYIQQVLLSDRSRVV
jgi:hypothetical protein